MRFESVKRLSRRDSFSILSMQRRGSVSSDNVLMDILKKQPQDDSSSLLKNLLKENIKKGEFEIFFLKKLLFF